MVTIINECIYFNQMQDFNEPLCVQPCIKVAKVGPRKVFYITIVVNPVIPSFSHMCNYLFYNEYYY